MIKTNKFIKVQSLLSLNASLNQKEQQLQASNENLIRLQLELNNRNQKFHYNEQFELVKARNSTVDKNFKLLLLGPGKASEVFLGFLRPKEIIRVKLLDRETYEAMSRGRVIAMVLEYQNRLQKEEIARLKYKFGTFSTK